ncbi:MAG: hypothetical protein ACKVS9_18250 [Phycisphaerae bacterium]
MPRRRTISGLLILLGSTLVVAALVTTAGAQQAAGTPSAASQPAAVESSIDAAVADLASDEFNRREAATRTLIARGPAIMPELRKRFEAATDLEVKYRLKYVIENVAVPAQAVLIVRPDLATQLAPGELITHVNSRRVRNDRELLQRMTAASGGSLLRVSGPSGPREVGPIGQLQLPTRLDYVSPRGELIADAVRLYASGLAEQAAERVRQLPADTPENELSSALRARILFSAGSGAEALKLVESRTELARPPDQRSIWNSPSWLDFSGPGKAPFHIEWQLLTAAGPEQYAALDDPDLRVQRVLMPADRHVAALYRASELWWASYRDALDDSRGRRSTAGNQIAIVSLMFSKLGLRSECARLIEPRSEILRRSLRGRRKWVRVETDAWLPFVAGDAKGAVDGFYDDAIDVLQQPPRTDDVNAVIRNPQIAARVAFFLYHPPIDPRSEEILPVVNHPGHPAQTEYIDWMLKAIEERNHETIRAHLREFLPRISDEVAGDYATSLALIESIQARPDVEVLQTLRQRVAQSPASAQREERLLTLDVLALVHAAKLKEARELLAGADAANQPQFATLVSTVEYLWNPPASAANHTVLKSPIAAVLIGASGNRWLILTRDRRLMNFEAETGKLDAIQPPETGWFPSPLTWPWIGREAASGRVWAYGRLRVLELTPGQDKPLSMNLATASIPDFDRLLAPHFSRLAEAVAAASRTPGEDGEFLRSELKYGQQFFIDPDLPELAAVRTLAQDDRIVHFALRGGPHVIVDRTSGKAWTSIWMQQKLGLEQPPMFSAQALWRDAHGPDPVAMLMSDQGLIRFDLATETLTRVSLLGDGSHPSVIPESLPYERRDARFFYCARLPQDGGKVFRLTLPAMTVEALDIVNEALPPEYYLLQPRGVLRAQLDAWLRENKMLGLQEFIQDAIDTVAKWDEPKAENP